jgi:membrane protease YdiL (CAAX protease family)
MPTTLHEVLRWWPAFLGYLGFAALARPAARLLPPRRRYAVPWGLLEVLASFVLWFLWTAPFLILLTMTPLGQWLYGPEVIAKALQPDGSTADRFATVRLGLLATALAFPFQLLSIPFLLRLASETRPYQLGLTTHRLGRNVLLGVLGCLLLAPVVYGLNALFRLGYSELTRDSGAEHIFTQVARQPGLLTPAEWGLLVFAAVVSAPVLEELLFRGVLLRWLSRRWWGGDAALAAALAAALLARAGQFVEACKGKGPVPVWPAALVALAPALFVLAMVPGYLLVRSRQRTPFGTALYGSSLLFGITHAAAWPDPVPLFVLAVGLGWLAQRTQSLVGPVVLHALFNGIACAQLLTQP